MLEFLRKENHNIFILDSILVIIFSVHIYFVGNFYLFFYFQVKETKMKKRDRLEILLPSPGKTIKDLQSLESEGVGTQCCNKVREEINDVFCEQEGKKVVTQCYPATHDASEQPIPLIPLIKVSILASLGMACNRTRSILLKALGM